MFLYVIFLPLVCSRSTDLREARLGVMNHFSPAQPGCTCLEGAPGMCEVDWSPTGVHPRRQSKLYGFSECYMVPSTVIHTIIQLNNINIYNLSTKFLRKW